MNKLSLLMKKLFALLALAMALSCTVNAQWTYYGARLALGPSYVTDDLLTSSPILGASLGGYAEYAFEEMKNPLADNLYLQVGLNLSRRGTNFDQVFTTMRSYRYGYIHAYYAQIPAYIGYRYDLPYATAGNYINFFVGPSVSCGLFGRWYDRQVTPGNPQGTVNYDTRITGDKYAGRAFRQIRRIDAAAVLGVGYQWNDFTFDFIYEHGFVSLRYEPDLLVNTEITANGGNEVTYTHTNDDGTTTTTTRRIKDRNAYTGTNQSFLLAVGYRIPIR